MCFMWIWEQTAIISLYNINWLVFEHIRKALPLLCCTKPKFKSNSCCFQSWHDDSLQQVLLPSPAEVQRTTQSSCTYSWISLFPVLTAAEIKYLLSLTYLICQTRNCSAIYHMCGHEYPRQFDDNTGCFLLGTVHYLHVYSEFSRC
jgi:hypothetical protein